MKIEKNLLANQLSFGALGAIEGAWVPMVPFVKSNLNLNDADLGMLMSAMAVGSILALPIVGTLVSRYGCRAICTVSGILMALILVGLSFSSSFIFCAIMLGIFGMSMIGLDVGSNINAVIVEKEYERPLMSGFHGGYSLGTFAGTLAMSLMLSIGMGVKTGALVMLVIMTLIIIKGCEALISNVKQYEDKKDDKDEDNSKLKKGIPLTVIVIGMLCFIMYGTEGAVLNWSAVFSHDIRNVDMEHAGYMYLFYAIAMTFTRLTGNKLVKMIGRCKAVVLGASLVSIGFLVATSVPHVIGVMIGWTIIGLGAGNVVPQLVSFTGSIKGIKLHNAITIVNSIGYSGILCSPMIVGYISEHSSLIASFNTLAVGTFIVATVGFFLLKEKK